MISKNNLQKIISKYNLGGLVESVKWVIKDKSLHIIFNTPNKAMIGEIEYTGIDLPDSEIAIYDTSQLDKLISITTGELNLNVIEHKLIIEDMNYTLSYPLADSLLIQTPKQVNESNGYHIECALETEHLSNIIKAKNALASDHLIFTITKNFDGDNVLTIIFGNNESYTNKIEYMIANSNIDTSVNPMFNLPFDSEAIKVVMANNKDADDITMKLNTNGLLKLEFEGENWKSKYFFVRKAE